MAITEYEDEIQTIIDNDSPEEFIYDFLRVYEGVPKATVTKLRKGINNSAKEPDAVYLKNKMYFKKVSATRAIMQAYQDTEDLVKSYGSKPRYIIVTNFDEFLAKDTKTEDTLDIKYADLPQHFEFFLAWNGIEKADFDKENPADVRAAERFAKLYDVVVKDNPSATRKGLNLFLIRTLFCLFAEDTEIFEKNLFTDRIKQMTKEDGSNLDSFFDKLFGVLDYEKRDRPKNTPSWLNDFPYVDGDLFKDPHEHLHFTGQSRKLIIAAGEKLSWDQINPDILGSMLQAVASEDSRSHLGMHYTSVPNIMKVIKPLFLDELRQSFEDAKGNIDELNKLYDRIGKIKFMDPACGSGNFLIITYKELRQLEIDILKELNNMGFYTMYVPSVTLKQFYGIEIEDFACDVTRLSLWIAEHQMNVKLKEEISDAIRPTLPLQHAGAIVCGNALRIDWNVVLPHDRDDEVYLFGNPPYLGAKKQTTEQKKDLINALDGNKGYKKLDYIAGWFQKAADYIQNTHVRSGFVTTNSIIQGEQVNRLWPNILDKCYIQFAYTSFKWRNNAKGNAGVTVSIIGLSAKVVSHNKLLMNGKRIKEVENISPYLTEGTDEIVKSTNKNINGDMPTASLGCLPLDGGNLIFSEEEYRNIINQTPVIANISKKYIGSNEFINGKTRYVLWLDHDLFNEYKSIPIVKQRVELVKKFRSNGGQSARSAVNRSYEFFTRKLRDECLENSREHEMMTIIIPRVSSENRIYVPMGMVGEDTVISDSATAIYNAPIWLLGLLESRMHMTWLKAVGGRLKTDYRYSASLVYNTFPIPKLSTRRKNEIEGLIYDILDIREEEGGTLAELYGSPLAEKNPKPMNQRLLKAHQKLDQVVDRAYMSQCHLERPFKDDNERLSLLLKMYSTRMGDEK
ncbi:class I SAM-dependent DNA methyltransferase [Limosilactobacillus mucosae]